MVPSRIDPYAQTNAERRDYTFEKEAIQKAGIVLTLVICPPLALKKRTLWTPIYSRYNYADEQYYNRRNMDAMLVGTFRPTL